LPKRSAESKVSGSSFVFTSITGSPSCLSLLPGPVLALELYTMQYLSENKANRSC
jgi:hypothetical protein